MLFRSTLLALCFVSAVNADVDADNVFKNGRVLEEAVKAESTDDEADFYDAFKNGMGFVSIPAQHVPG